MAKVLLEYDANIGELKAVLKQIEDANVQITESATQSAKKVTDEYAKTSQAAKNAFAGQEVKKAVDNQAQSIDKLRQELEDLFNEQVKLLRQEKQNTQAFKDNAQALDATRKEFDKINGSVKQLNNSLPKTSQEVGELEDELRKLALEGKQGSEEFQNIAKRIGEYRAAITSADRAVDLYAKSTDAATSRIGELEDKLFDLAIAGQRNTQEFKDTIAEVAKLKRAVFEVDQQVDSYVERSRGLATVVQNVELIGNAFQIAEGASAIFGDESKELEEALIKLNGIMAITNGLSQVRNILLEQEAQKTGIAALVQRGYTIAVGKSTGAIKAFRVALASIGIGALIAAIAIIIDKLAGYRSEQDKLTDSIKRTNEALRDGDKAIKSFEDRIEEAAIKAKIANGEITQSQADLNKELKELEKQAKLAYLPLVQESNRLSAQLDLVNFKLNSQNKILETAKEGSPRYVGALSQITFLERQREEIIEQQNKVSEKQNELISKGTELRKALIKEAQNEAEAEADLQKIRTLEITAEQRERANTILQIERDKEQERQELEETRARFISRFLIKIDDTTNQEILNQRATFLKKLEAIGEGGLNNRIAVIRAEADAQIAGIKETLGFTNDAQNQIAIIEAETQEKIRAERQKAADELKQQVFDYAFAISNAFSSIAELSAQVTENRIADIERLRDAEIKANNTAEQSFASRKRNEEAINTRFNRRVTEEKRKQARIDKASGIFEAVLNTAVAVTNALKEKPPLNFILAAIAGAAGAVQIAKISSEPLPAFGKGGWVDGEPHTRGGVNINAEGGEFVTNKQSARTHKAELEAMNKGRESFLKLIQERYVRPQLVEAMRDKDRGFNVNVDARLNSSTMEKELIELRRETKRTGKAISKVLTSNHSSRYSW